MQSEIVSEVFRIANNEGIFVKYIIAILDF